MAARARAHGTRRVTVEQKWPGRLSDGTAVPVGPVMRVDNQDQSPQPALPTRGPGGCLSGPSWVLAGVERHPQPPPTRQQPCLLGWDNHRCLQTLPVVPGGRGQVISREELWDQSYSKCRVTVGASDERHAESPAGHPTPVHPGHAGQASCPHMRLSSQVVTQRGQALC